MVIEQATGEVGMAAISAILAPSYLCFGSLSCWNTTLLWNQIVMFDCKLEEVFQNNFVHVLIHYTFNSMPNSRSKSYHTTPNHDMSTTMFHCLLDMLRLYKLSICYPTPWPTIGIKLVYLCLITENNVFPIMNGPICIHASKPNLCLNMFSCQQWLLLLHMCNETFPSQSMSHSYIRHNFTNFISNLCCHLWHNSQTPFRNQGDTSLPLSCNKVFWVPSFLPVKLLRDLFSKPNYPRLTHPNCILNFSCWIAIPKLLERLELLWRRWTRHIEATARMLTTTQSPIVGRQNALII